MRDLHAFDYCFTTIKRTESISHIDAIIDTLKRSHDKINESHSKVYEISNEIDNVQNKIEEAKEYIFMMMEISSDLSQKIREGEEKEQTIEEARKLKLEE